MVNVGNCWLGKSMWQSLALFDWLLIFNCWGGFYYCFHGTMDRIPIKDKTGLQPVSRACGTTPFGFRIVEEKPDRHNVLKTSCAYCSEKPVIKGMNRMDHKKKIYGVVLKVILPTRSELFLFCSFLGELLGVGGCQSCFKTCVPQVKNSKHNCLLFFRAQ